MILRIYEEFQRCKTVQKLDYQNDIIKRDIE